MGGSKGQAEGIGARTKMTKRKSQECQQQMIEILEKVSEQVKKVENIRSGSMPALEGEYYTPPVSQIKVN